MDSTLNKVQETERYDYEQAGLTKPDEAQPVVEAKAQPEAQKSDSVRDDVDPSSQDAAPPTLITDAAQQVMRTATPREGPLLSGSQQFSVSPHLVLSARLTTRELRKLRNEGKGPGRLRNSEQELVNQPPSKNKAKAALAEILKKLKVPEGALDPGSVKPGGPDMPESSKDLQASDGPAEKKQNRGASNDVNKVGGLRESTTTLGNKESTSQSQSSQNVKKIKMPAFNFNHVQGHPRAPPLTSGLRSRIDAQAPPATTDDSAAARPPTTLRGSENDSYTSIAPRFPFQVQNHVRIIKQDIQVKGRTKMNPKRSKTRENTESWAQMLQGKNKDNKDSKSRAIEKRSDMFFRESLNNHKHSQSQALLQKPNMAENSKVVAPAGEDLRHLDHQATEHREDNNDNAECEQQKISYYQISLKDDKGRNGTKDDQSAAAQFTVNHRFTVSTVPKLVFQKQLKERHVKDEKETDLALNPLMKKYAVKQQRQPTHTRALIVKGQRKESNQDLPQLQMTARSQSYRKISSGRASATKKGQYDSHGTGFHSKSDQVMRNKYDRSSKGGPRSILAKEVSIDDVPSRHNDNMMQSLIFSGQSSGIEDESPTALVQRGADDQTRIENKSILSTMNLAEPAISVKRVRNRSQQFGIQKRQGTEELHDIPILQTMQSPDKVKQSQLVPLSRSKNSEQKLELHQKQNDVQKMQLASPEDQRDAQVVWRQQFQIPQMLQVRSRGRQITKPSHLSNMVNSSYIMAYLDHRPFSLKPPLLKRLQDQTYRERFGFEDSGYAYRILKQWFELKNPFARLRRVRYLAEKSKTYSEQIMYNKLYLDEMTALQQYKYDHKGARCLRAMRTEQQLSAWRHASQLFLEGLSNKKRLKSRQQRIFEFQQYMDSVILSEASDGKSQDGTLDELQWLAPSSDKPKEENQRIEEESKSTIFQESTFQQDKNIAAFNNATDQDLHQVRRAIMNKRMISKIHLQQSASVANKDIFLEDQNLEFAPNQTSNSDDYAADDKQLSQNQRAQQRTLDSRTNLQLVQLQSMEANTLRLNPGTSSDRTQFKTKFKNFDLINGADRRSINIDSLESRQNLTDRQFLTEESLISVRGQAITTQRLHLQQPNEQQPKERERTQNQSTNSHHFRVKIPSQVDPNQASLNVTLPPKKAEMKLKRNNRSQNFPIHQPFAKGDDASSSLKGKVLEGDGLNEKDSQSRQQSKTPKYLRPSLHELEDNNKASAKASQFLIQGESFLNNTLKLESSQVQESSAVNQQSNQRTLNQLLNSNKTYDLLIIGGQAIQASDNAKSSTKAKPLTPESQPEEKVVMAPITALAPDRAAPRNVQASTSKELSQAATKLKSTLNKMEVTMEIKKIGISPGQDRKAGRREDIRKIKSEEKKKRQIEKDLKLKREENALQNMRKFKNEASGRMMEVKSLKPKAFVFRMYPNDSSLQTIESRDISPDNLSLVRNLDENNLSSPDRSKFNGIGKAIERVVHSRNLPLRQFNKDGTRRPNQQNSNTHGGGEIALTDSRPGSIIIRTRSEKTQHIMVSGGVSTNIDHN